jgi:hypothetical protein
MLAEKQQTNRLKSISDHAESSDKPGKANCIFSRTTRPVENRFGCEFLGGECPMHTTTLHRIVPCMIMAKHHFLFFFQKVL